MYLKNKIRKIFWQYYKPVFYENKYLENRSNLVFSVFRNNQMATCLYLSHDYIGEQRHLDEICRCYRHVLYRIKTNMKPLESLAFAEVSSLPYQVIQCGSEVDIQILQSHLLLLPSKFLVLLADVTSDICHAVARVIEIDMGEYYEFDEFQEHFRQWKSDHIWAFEELNEDSHKDILVNQIIKRNRLIVEFEKQYLQSKI